MKYSPEERHRKSIRLKEYDYSQTGAYFLTICTHNMKCVFGDVVNGKMQLNEYGKIVKNEWLQTAVIRSNVELDVFIVMPNHIHGIIMLTNDGRGVLQYAPTNNVFRSPSQTVGAIIRGFKSIVTKRVNIIRGATDISVWQRNYYEHIIHQGLTTIYNLPFPSLRRRGLRGGNK